MKVTSAEFVKSAFQQDQWINDGLAEIAFLGRSNVGKSSLLNSLLGRRGLARTSNTPGRTQSINFFRINEKFYFVDLPGYGYARVSKSMRADWGKMAEDYLSNRESLVLSVQLVDIRHEPSALDIELNQWLHFHEKPHLVVATKADKLSANQRQKNLDAIRKEFSGSAVLSFSSVTQSGKDDIWSVIADAIHK